MSKLQNQKSWRKNVMVYVLKQNVKLHMSKSNTQKVISIVRNVLLILGLKISFANAVARSIGLGEDSR